jgi:RNA polymerase sigma factor (TIGR02999 family)
MMEFQSGVGNGQKRDPRKCLRRKPSTQSGRDLDKAPTWRLISYRSHGHCETLMNDVTLMLGRSGGDQKLLAEKVLPLVYEELRKLATARMARESAGHTLQPTALVHEVWLKLVHDGGRTWANRSHFYRAAAIAMRRILIDRARQKLSIKRAGGWQRVNVADLEMAAASPDDHLLLIDESLKQLEIDDPESAEVVMLKFFSGLTNKDTARTLEISEATVERRWAFAKVRLFQIIRESQADHNSER